MLAPRLTTLLVAGGFLFAACQTTTTSRKKDLSTARDMAGSVEDLAEPVEEDLAEPVEEDLAVPRPADLSVVTDREDTDGECGDGIDNDGDGHTDCDDFDCCKAGVPASGVTVCASGTCYGPGYGPRDGGTTRDLTSTGVGEDTNKACGDGIDNDGDGHTDCNDFNCCQAGTPAPGVTVCAVGTCYGPGYGPKDGGVRDLTGGTGPDLKLPPETGDDDCSDGIDNDTDGFTDCNDYSCCKNGTPASGVTVCAPTTCIGPGKPI